MDARAPKRAVWTPCGLHMLIPNRAHERLDAAMIAVGQLHPALDRNCIRFEPHRHLGGKLRPGDIGMWLQGQDEGSNHTEDVHCLQEPEYLYGGLYNTAGLRSAVREPRVGR